MVVQSSHEEDMAPDLLQKKVKELQEENTKLRSTLESRELILNRCFDVIDDMSVCQDFDEDKAEIMIYYKNVLVPLVIVYNCRIIHILRSGSKVQKRAHCISESIGLQQRE